MTGLTPRCSRRSCPAARLTSSVPTVTEQHRQPVLGDGAQRGGLHQRADRDADDRLRADHRRAAAAPAGAGRAAPGPARRRRPPNSGADGTPTAVSTTPAATPTARTHRPVAEQPPSSVVHGLTCSLGPGFTPQRPGDPPELGDVRGEGRPALRGQRERGALPGGDRRLAHRDVAGLLELLDVLGQHRVADPDRVADRGEVHRVDRGEQPADLQPRRGVDDGVEPRLDGGHSVPSAQLGDVDAGPPPAGQRDADAEHRPADHHRAAPAEPELRTRRGRQDHGVADEPDPDRPPGRPRPEAVDPEAGDPLVGAHAAPGSRGPGPAGPAR